jgi:MFS family permease
MLLVFRIMTGGAAAAVQAVGAGTVADLWAVRERGTAMSIFYVGPLCGPGLAPIVGGALAEAYGWRSTLWALVIFGGALLIMIVSCLPETVARDRALDNTKSFVARFVDPLKTLKLLQYPPIIVTVYSGGLSFASLYVVLIAIQTNFGHAPYNFSTIAVGLLYIAPTLGCAVASQTGGRWIDHIMAREARKAGRYDTNGKLRFLPEDRMKENLWLAASLYPAALLWYGWVVDKHVYWIVSCIANFFFGIGSMLVFSCVTTMLTEFTPKRSSSGVALNNFVRQILATIAAVVVQPLINAMGTGWMCTMIALFAWVTGNLALFTLLKRGPKWRVKMDEKLNSQNRE